MKRNIDLCLEDIDSNDHEYQKVSVYNIDKIINSSCDIIKIDILEYLNPPDCLNIITKSLQKLKPNGYLVASFSNFKKLCYEYSSGKLDNVKMIEAIKNKQNIISVQYLQNIIQQQYSIVNLVENDLRLEASITRRVS